MTPRRITVVASELLGRAGTGGAGTADSLLAVALGRHGHDVELLVASGRAIGPLNERWTRIYADAAVGVRILERRADVQPAFLVPAYEVYEALRERPPDVAIVNDWRGLGFCALRARQCGVALDETAFVVHCHGPGRVLTAFAQKVPNTVERFGEQVAEQGSLALADAVVSPSRWLLDWMRDHRWPVARDARVIQYLRQSTALGDEPPRPASTGPIRRLAFFGQLREGKGIRIFLASLHALEPSLVERVELLFLGSASKRWTPERIVDAAPESLRASARVETALDRDAALEELRRPGTLAVMPSLLDNSPNTLAECIEYGIPFVATATGGIPELVADADRDRVLCAPTATALADTLRRALTAEHFAPARAARKPQASLDAWLELVDTVRPARAHDLEPTDCIVVRDENVEPDDALMDMLKASVSASGADAVTCAVRSADGIRLFLGDPGALGLLENHYGVVGLVRSSAARAAASPDDAVDPAWVLFARLALDGATIVSVPHVLATHNGRPGRVDDVPGDGLAILEAFESSPAPPSHDLPQLAATLGAALASSRARDGGHDERESSLLRRLKTSLRSD